MNTQENEVVDGVCDVCDGEGTISTDESDGEGHIMRGVGTAQCWECSDTQGFEYE